MQGSSTTVIATFRNNLLNQKALSYIQCIITTRACSALICNVVNLVCYDIYNY